MNGDQPSRRPVIIYLGGVVGIATAIVTMLVVLYLFRIPEFTDELVQNPIAAGQEFPFAVLLVVGILGSIVLLIALIVGFGVHYGPERRRREPKQ